MNFYEATVEFNKQEGDEVGELANLHLFPSSDSNDYNTRGYKHFMHVALTDLNEAFDVDSYSEKTYTILFNNIVVGKANIIFMIDNQFGTLDGALDYIKEHMEETCYISDVKISCIHEISISRFKSLGGERVLAYSDRIDVDYMDNTTDFCFSDKIIDNVNLTLDEAIAKAREFMADSSFIEELERIYSSDNPKQYFGHPVHYKISASNMEAAMDISEVLVQALRANHRLESGRIDRIYDIDPRCSDSAIKDLLKVARGNIVLIELVDDDESHENYASTYEGVVETFCKLIARYHTDTLYIFVDSMNPSRFSSSFIAKVSDKIDVIEIKEGCGNKVDTINFIEGIAKRHNYNKITRSDIEEIMPDKSLFTVGEAYDIYNAWFKNDLRNKVYKAYKYCSFMTVNRETKKSEPYDELQNMIGLQEIKDLVDNIIDNAKIQKMRSKMGLDSHNNSLHMIFTGNPGSAKTTVARLMAQIFAKENIISRGIFIECGRADLVGKYVGWTAKAVQAKFKEAKGGVLFIDEAYSLVDDRSGSFGDEAINTIVQEMENNRYDVIVIFAGYPDKMADFLDKNEGLRSRISFHLDFPDYKADELLRILKLMASKKGYKLNRDIEVKCLDIFRHAIKHKEFGNGRYARNLLEQAIIAQARRISREYNNQTIGRRELTALEVTDFDVNMSRRIAKESTRRIGFGV